MTIQWYPGHMHKAYKEIRKSLARIDVVIEILDARIPYSSTNPAFDNMLSTKPVIKLLNKADLADPDVLTGWRNHLEQSHGVKTLLASTTKPDQLDQVTALAHKLCPAKHRQNRVINVMISGIPNVGKSTVINRLAGKAVAKTGNEPAVTRAQQTIRIGRDIILHDTPGVLWPKIENQNSGYRLAITSAIRDTVTDIVDIALFAASYLLKAYPDLLLVRYQLDELPPTDIEMLEYVGRRRGCLRSGGLIDHEKAARALLTDIRSGALGKVCLETPDLVQLEQKAPVTANNEVQGD
jgi:ribosome biogenesis GTPase A